MGMEMVLDLYFLMHNTSASVIEASKFLPSGHSFITSDPSVHIMDQSSRESRPVSLRIYNCMHFERLSTIDGRTRTQTRMTAPRLSQSLPSLQYSAERGTRWLSDSASLWPRMRIHTTFIKHLSLNSALGLRTFAIKVCRASHRAFPDDLIFRRVIPSCSCA